MKNIWIWLVLLISCMHFSSGKSQSFGFDLEIGQLKTGYNDVRIPGDGGTLFSFKDDLIPMDPVFWRLQMIYSISEKHTFSILYAPLRVVSNGSLSRDIIFVDELFPANSKISGTYRFNSYRLRYQYGFVNNEKITFGAGLTLKIRDALIRLEDDYRVSELNDFGLVPLISFRFTYRFANRFTFLIDGDALAVPQGRAEDVLIAISYQPDQRFRLKAGYRLLEGGADNKTIYTFSLFHYGVLGMVLYF